MGDHYRVRFDRAKIRNLVLSVDLDAGIEDDFHAAFDQDAGFSNFFCRSQKRDSHDRLARNQSF